MSTDCSHCSSPASSHCSCGDFLCASTQSSHFLRGHHSVPLLLHQQYYSAEAEITTVPTLCAQCDNAACSLLCTCEFPWLFFCRNCAEKHVAAAEQGRHGLEPLSALQFLRRKSDKRGYIERQLLLDEVTECLKGNLDGVSRAKGEFELAVGRLIEALIEWKGRCLNEFDGLGVEEDVRWALDRLESQRFRPDREISYGFDLLLTCTRVDEVRDLLTAVHYELFTDSILQALPGCFSVQNRLKDLQRPAESFTKSALKPASVTLRDVHSTDICDELRKINENLADSLRILRPEFEFSRIIPSGVVGCETEIKQEAALASKLSREVFTVFTDSFAGIRAALGQILTEMRVEETVAGGNCRFSEYLARFREATVEAVANMSGIAHALKSTDLITQLSLDRDAAYSQAALLAQQHNEDQSAREQLTKEYEACLPLRQENEELRDKNKSLREELERLRLSLSLGLGESVKEIMESAKERIRRSEESAVSTLDFTSSSLSDWTSGLYDSLSHEKAVLLSRWSAFPNAPSLDSVCDFLRQSDDRVIESSYTSLKTVKETINHSFRRMQLEIEGMWDKMVTEVGETMEKYQKTLKKSEELPSFGMFQNTITSEIVESRNAIEEGGATIQKYTEDLLELHNSISSAVDSIQRKQVKKKDRPATYSRLQASLSQLLAGIIRIRDVKDALHNNLKASFVSFEEAGNDPNFARLAGVKEAMEKKQREMGDTVRDLNKSIDRLKSSVSASTSATLSLFNTQHETIPSSLQAHKASVSSLIDTTIAPIVSAILQTKTQCEGLIDAITAKIRGKEHCFREEITGKRMEIEQDFQSFRRPFPEDIPVKPVMLSETMTGLIGSNESLHEEVGFLTRGLSDATRALSAEELKFAAGRVEKEVQMVIGAVLAQWIGRAAKERRTVEVGVREKMPDIAFPIIDVSPPSEPPEILRALISESSLERKSTLLKQLLPERFSAVPMTTSELWHTIDSRLIELTSTPAGELMSSDLLISEMRKPDIERMIVALSTLASRGQPKAILFLRIFGLEDGARAVPKDFCLIVKYMRQFRVLAEQYLRGAGSQWKKAEMYQMSRNGEAWLDDVLTKFAHQFSGEVWYAFLKYCKPVSISNLQFLLFLINWKLSTQNLRKEAPPLWSDPSASILQLHHLSTTVISYLDAWLPAAMVQNAIAELSPMGYVDRNTLEACISRTAYMSMMKDDRFVVRGDMFLLGILEAHFTIQRINGRKLAEAYENACIREGRFTKAAFCSAVRMIAKEEGALEELYEEAARVEGGGACVRLEAFLRVMARHKYALFIHQMQVY